jgi:hypothetical protein
MIQGKRNPGLKVKESCAEMLSVGSSQSASTVALADLDAAIEFVGRNREVSFEVDPQSGNSCPSHIFVFLDTLEKLVSLVLIDQYPLPDPFIHIALEHSCRNNVAQEHRRQLLFIASPVGRFLKSCSKSQSCDTTMARVWTTWSILIAVSPKAATVCRI